MSIGSWIKKWWKWLLFPIGVLVWLIGRASAKKTIKVASPELAEHMQLRYEVDAKTAERMAAAEIKRDAQLEEVNRETTEKVKAMQAEMSARVPELRQNPDELTKFLKDAGKGVSTKTRG